MHILIIGLNHRTAPVEVRELLAFTAEGYEEAFDSLKKYPEIHEGVILSTCNRTEVYVALDRIPAGREQLLDFFLTARQLDWEAYRQYLYEYTDDDAVRHLYRVACGLDSMILGETQILGQVKDAYLTAQKWDAVGKILHNLFSGALSVGKRAHSETAISQNATSVSYAAVELARKVFENLNGKQVMVIGAGKMSRLTVKHLQAQGVRRIVVANRNLERAGELAGEFEGEAISLDEVGESLALTDLVISSTGAPDLVITRDLVSEAMRRRRYRPLFMVDIAVPRDIDSSAGQIENVFLYDIDDLEAVVQANLKEREREARQVERIVLEEVKGYKRWLRTLDVVPLIRSLREKAERIRRQELEKAFNKLPSLGPEEKRVIDRLSSSIVNKILNHPTWRIKQLANAENGDVYLDTLSQLFNLEPDGPGSGTQTELGRNGQKREVASGAVEGKPVETRKRTSVELVPPVKATTD